MGRKSFFCGEIEGRRRCDHFWPTTRSFYATELHDSQSEYGHHTCEGSERSMAKLLEGSELILVNPLDPELRKLAAATFNQVVRQSSDVRSAVLARSRALSKAGYHEQVKVDENFTGFLAYRGKSRVPVRP